MGTDIFQGKIHIRKFTKNTENIESAAAAVDALAKEIWHEHYTPIIGAEQVRYMLEKFQSAEQICADIKHNDYIYFTAENTHSNETVGYCACQPGENHLFLSKMYIRKDFRGRGLAGSLMEEMTALCRYEYNFDKIRLNVAKPNTGSIAAYKKMGFETVDSVKIDIGGGFYMDDFLMELQINRKKMINNQ